MCKDTQNFITKQLYPVYMELRDYISVEYVLWGKSKYENGGVTCQFGDDDCWANRIQRCALDGLLGNEDKQMDYMFCEYLTKAAINKSYECVYNNGLNPQMIDYCINSERGVGFEFEAAQRTIPLQITFVPTIVYGGQFEDALSKIAFKDFRSTTCSILQKYYPVC